MDEFKLSDSLRYALGELLILSVDDGIKTDGIRAQIKGATDGCISFFLISESEREEFLSKHFEEESSARKDKILKGVRRIGSLVGDETAGKSSEGSPLCGFPPALLVRMAGFDLKRMIGDVRGPRPTSEMSDEEQVRFYLGRLMLFNPNELDNEMERDVMERLILDSLESCVCRQLDANGPAPEAVRLLLERNLSPRDLRKHKLFFYIYVMRHALPGDMMRASVLRGVVAELQGKTATDRQPAEAQHVLRF